MTSLSIAEAAERTGLTAHTLRYYERDGLLLHWCATATATSPSAWTSCSPTATSSSASWPR
jgi:hypothetical protein